MAWLLAAPVSLVFTRSSGRNSLFFVAQVMLVQSRTDSFRFDGDSSVTGLGANPTVVGVGRVPQGDEEVEPQKTVSQVAVVVNAPVRRAAPQARPKVRHAYSCFMCAGIS